MTPPITDQPLTGERKELFDMVGKLYQLGCVSFAAEDEALTSETSKMMGAMIQVLLMNVPDGKISIILDIIKNGGPEQVRTE